MDTHKKFLFALEDDQTVLNEEFNNTELESTDSIQNVINKAECVNDVTASFEEAVDDTETLNLIQKTIADDGKENIETDNDSIEIANVVIENICNKLGIKNKYLYKPSLESNNKTNNVKIVLEGLTDIIKNIWESIKRFVKMIGEKIMDFINSIFGTIEPLEKDIGNLTLKVNKSNFDNLANLPPIKSEKLAMAFIDQDRDTNTHGITSILKSTAVSVENVEIKVKTINKRLEKFNIFLNNKQFDIPSAVDLFIKETFVESGQFDKITDNTTDLKLINNSFITFSNNFGLLKFEVKQRKNKTILEDIQVLNKSDCLFVLKESSEIIKHLKKLKSIQNDIKENIKTTVNISNNVINNLIENQTDENKQLLSKLASYIRSYNTEIPNYISFILSNGLNTVRYSIEYVKASIDKIDKHKLQNNIGIKL